MHPPLLEGLYLQSLYSLSVYLEDSLNDSSYFQCFSLLASTDCDVGHGVLRGLDQGKVRVNEQLGHLGRRVPPSASLSRSLFKGSGKRGVGKSEARTSRASSP